MSRIQLKKGREDAEQARVIGRVREALAHAVEADRGSHRQRVVWGVLVGLSSLALTVHHPALAQDDLWRDRQQDPREPEPGTNDRNFFSAISSSAQGLGRARWPEDPRTVLARILHELS